MPIYLVSKGNAGSLADIQFYWSYLLLFFFFKQTQKQKYKQNILTTKLKTQDWGPFWFRIAVCTHARAALSCFEHVTVNACQRRTSLGLPFLAVPTN
jgi:hypothetical protein